MVEFSAMNWIKLFHLFFVILWIGSLFVMPYLLLQKFEGAKKLYWRLQFPCMIAAISLGVYLLIQNPVRMKIGFFHMKLTAVCFLIGLDLWIGKMANRPAAISRSRCIAFKSAVSLLTVAVLVAVQLVAIQLTKM
ncbi:MAG TPA: CopD family protein [Chlamydiales bacterium]|nr:CopD family protein [Chlamydiales bacterium]